MMDGQLETQRGERLVRLIAQAKDVLDTCIGTQAAEAVPTRIEYGVFS